MGDSFTSETANSASFSSRTTDKSPDNFEPINIEGQEGTGIWVHQPGSEVSQTWEPRKGKSKRLDNQVDGVPGDSFGGTHSGPLNNESSSSDENTEGKRTMNKVRHGLHKLSSVFRRGPKNEENSGRNEETVQSPYANIKAVNHKEIGVKFIVEDTLPASAVVKNPKEVNLSPEGSGSESPGKGNVKGMAKSILKRAEKSARNIKHVLSRKGSRKSSSGLSDVTEQEISPESDSSDDESLTSPQVQRIPVVSSSTSSSYGNDLDDKIKERVVQAGSSESAEDQMKNVDVEGLERIDENEVASSSSNGGNGLEELSEPQPTEKKLDGNGLQELSSGQLPGKKLDDNRPEEFSNTQVPEDKSEGEMRSDAENVSL